jgi:hypothetical protein
MAALAASVLFGIAQFPLLRKSMTDDARPAALDPPEPGF